MTNFAKALGVPRVLLCRADEPKTQLPRPLLYRPLVMSGDGSYQAHVPTGLTDVNRVA
jgi:hypothetical protein